MRKILWIACLCTLVLTGCQPAADDPTAGISFSVDTLCFGTVFTDMSSSTRVVMVHNRTKQAQLIEKVLQADGRYFRINLDGESSAAYLNNIRLQAGDSLYLFVNAKIDEQTSDLPVLVTDQVIFVMGDGSKKTLQIEAYGQDVTLIDSLYIDADYTFRAGKPYLIRHYVASAPGTTLTIEAGTVFYMHKDAQVHVYGSLVAPGTAEAPILFTCERQDDYVAGIPYAYVPGQWGGIYLYDYDGQAPTWLASGLRIVSAINGLYCYGKNAQQRPTLSLSGSVIHNHDQYGLVLLNVDADVSNSEISNCASHCLYIQGGTSRFEQNTIASYYRHTMYNSNVGLYDTRREDVSAVYVDNLSKTVPTRVSFVNNIITGVRSEQLMIASPLPDYYSGIFRCNYIKGDTLRLAGASGNVYSQDTDTKQVDTVFLNDYYADYVYYDFRLDSLSPARGIADSAVMSKYPQDLLGVTRTTLDAGCYAYVNDTTFSRP